MTKYILSILIITIILVAGNSAKAIERTQKPEDYRFPKHLISFAKSDINHYGKKGNKLQAVPQFFVLDSLANGYSYYTPDQMPFMYQPESNTLVTIKRGYSETDAGTANDINNTKNNLFILESKDLGYNWSLPIIIYNKAEVPLGDARYPSIYPFMYDGELAYGYMAPISTGAGWEGFIQGFYSESSSWIAEKKFQFEDERNDAYVFEATSNALLAYQKDNSFYVYGVSEPMPPTGTNNLSRQSSFAYIKNQDMMDWFLNVPENWNSDLFRPIEYQTTDSYKVRNSTISGIQKLDGDKWYIGAVGAFKDGDAVDSWQPGVSTSEDEGLTWTPFNIFPYSLVRQYATANGCNPDSTFLTSAMSFNVYAKDSYSFLSFMVGRDNTGTASNYDVVEVNYEGETWSIRKISDHGLYGSLLYLPAEGETSGTNQMNWEFQLSKTVDKTTLLAKWVMFYDIMDTEADTLISGGAQDVFVSTRIIGENSWSKPYNVTQTNEFDRITWIPNLIPNDLKDIPLLKTWTICDPSQLTGSEYSLKQRNLEVPQYVLMTHFNADPISKVNNDIDYGFNFNGIYPNPASDHIEITMSINKYDFYTIDIYDVLGNKMNNVFTGYQSAGLKAIVYNTEKLNTGTYFCVITSSNGNLTKSFNVVK
ncbi:MAG: T9SS type A sorting domain-containing protein [bacterium]